MRHDVSEYSCDLCGMKTDVPADLERVRSDVVLWRDKRPTVHADICGRCQRTKPISVLIEYLRGKLLAREQEKQREGK